MEREGDVVEERKAFFTLTKESWEAERFRFMKEEKGFKIDPKPLKLQKNLDKPLDNPSDNPPENSSLDNSTDSTSVPVLNNSEFSDLQEKLHEDHEQFVKKTGWSGFTKEIFLTNRTSFEKCRNRYASC